MAQQTSDDRPRGRCGRAVENGDQASAVVRRSSVSRSGATPWRPTPGRTRLARCGASRRRPWPYLALTALMYARARRVSAWLTLALAIPAAGFLLRTFIVFHDCTHGSFLPSQAGNLWLGRLSALLVFHAVRTAGATTTPSITRPPAISTGAAPATSPTLTVAEYLARSLQAAARLPALPQPARHVRARAAVVADHRPALGPAHAPAPALRSVIVATNIALVVLVGASAGSVGWHACAARAAAGRRCSPARPASGCSTSSTSSRTSTGRAGDLELRRRGAARQLAT